jgi:hypothetical protein
VGKEVSWIWKQRQGELWHNDEKVATGYSGGDEGKSPEGKNNPSMQDVPRVGPLPQGKYKFGTPVPQSHLGPFAIPLIPSPDNQMFERDDFYCHGDTIDNPGSASEGCIILARTIRNMIAASPDKDLEVISGE